MLCVNLNGESIYEQQNSDLVIDEHQKSCIFFNNIRQVISQNIIQMYEFNCII